MTRLKFLLIFSVGFLLIFCCTTGTALETNSTDNKPVKSNDYLNSEVSKVDYSYYHYSEDVGAVEETSNLSLSGGKKAGELNNSINNNSENVDNVPQRLPLTFGPETLDKLKSDPNFIAAYGSIPAFGSLDEREQWISLLGKLMYQVNANFEQEMSKYFYPKGPFTSCGITIDGVIEIGVGGNKTVEKSLMDGIYQILDSKANWIGIKEVPVVFMHRDLAVPLVAPVAEETANLSAPEGKNAVELNNSTKTNSIPGFGLLGGLACMYGGWRLRKK